MYIYNLCILWIRHVENLGQSQKKKKRFGGWQKNMKRLRNDHTKDYIKVSSTFQIWA